MRAFVTGAEGFAGSHLTELLLREGMETHGTYLDDTAFGALPDVVSQAKLARCDLRDREGIARLVLETSPDLVFHLAGVSSVPQSERNPALTVETNITGTCNVLDAVRDNAGQASVVMVSSAEVYGKVTREQVPLSEDAPVKPDNLYGVTKATVELLSKLYVARYGMDIVIVRPFNHIGPRQNPVFVCADFASQIAQIEYELMPARINVGDISVERDFTDVRDMMKGYLLAARRAYRGDTYNLCSGRTRRVEEILKTLLSFATVPIEIHQDPTKRRPSEIPILVGTAEKFRRVTGWVPEIPFETTLRDTLNYWRARVRPAQTQTARERGMG